MNTITVFVCAVLTLGCLLGGWHYLTEAFAGPYQRAQGLVLIGLAVAAGWLGADRYMARSNGGDYNAALTARISDRLGPYLAGADIEDMRLCDQSGVAFSTRQATCVTFEDGLTVDVQPAIVTESGELRAIERTIFYAMRDAKDRPMSTYRVYVDLSESPAPFEVGADEFGRIVAQALEAAKAEYAKHAEAEQAKATWGK